MWTGLRTGSHWRAHVNAVINLWVLQKAESFLARWATLSFSSIPVIFANPLTCPTQKRTPDWQLSAKPLLAAQLPNRGVSFRSAGFCLPCWHSCRVTEPVNGLPGHSPPVAGTVAFFTRAWLLTKDQNWETFVQMQNCRLQSLSRISMGMKCQQHRIPILFVPEEEHDKRHYSSSTEHVATWLHYISWCSTIFN